MAWLRRSLPPLLTLGAAALIWLKWTEISLLRGTVLWDLRFLVFGAAVIVLLTLIEWIVGRIGGEAGDR